MKNLILGVDAGSYRVKVAGPMGIDSFLSNVSHSFDKKVEEKFGEDDMSFNIDGQEGIAGTIAKYETRTGASSLFGGSKAHRNTKTRILLAVHRYITKYDLDVESVSLVTGQPVKGHVPNEKEEIIKMVVGPRNVTVNGKPMSLRIENVGVAPEGSAAFWSTPQDETGEILTFDCGSGTINAVCTIDQRFINTRSDTFDFGMETAGTRKLDDLAYDIVSQSTSLNWKKESKLLVCGEVAEAILPYIQTYYANAEVLYPVLQVGNKHSTLPPVYANAVGFYNIAKGAFK